MSVPLLLAPNPQLLKDPWVPNIPIGAAEPVKLNNLGPMVVNSEGEQ